MAKDIPVTREELDDLYNRQRLSIGQIAKQLNVSNWTVWGWMSHFNLPRRKNGESHYLRLDDEEIVRLYTVKRLGVPEIAQSFSVNTSTIYERLRACGIPIRSKSEALRLTLDDDEIVRLYTIERLSLAEVAQQFGVSIPTICSRLEARGIARRSISEAQRLKLDDNEIERLYIIERLPMAEIARQFGVKAQTILRRLEARGVSRRNKAEANQIYPRQDFSGDPLEKAYLQGFRLGDLSVKMSTGGMGSATIVISCSSTRIAQINLINDLFSPYGHVHLTPSRESEYAITSYLNPSFDFLLPKQDSIPEWILVAAQEGDVQPFTAFFAGYTDAEGCFCVPVDNYARFVLGSYDVGVLRQAQVILNEQLGVKCPPIRLAKVKGTLFIAPNNKQYFNNEDYWQLWVNRKASLNRLCASLSPYLKHAEKRQAMYAVWANVIARGVD